MGSKTVVRTRRKRPIRTYRQLEKLRSPEVCTPLPADPTPATTLLPRSPRSAPEGWIEQVSPSTGKIEYYHKDLGPHFPAKTQSEKPMGEKELIQWGRAKCRAERKRASSDWPKTP